MVILKELEMSVLKPVYKAYEWYISRNLTPENMPKHVAIIMDGNRRFSKIQGNVDIIEGHKRGVNTLERVLDWCLDLGIEILTAYAFSIENFKRPENEVIGLMNIFKENFETIAKNKKVHKNEVRIKAVGKLELLPDDVREAIKIAEESTANYNKRLVNIAIGYDGRLEIIDAIKKISKDVQQGKMDPEDIDEKIVNENLYTAGLEDPNLIIRTSGEERLSGFLLWQSSYSELYFCDSLWPELRKVDFLRALRSYQQRERRFGV
jgi:undecaprenyl diphosphate synthase